ncbi:MAG: hypothetical protein GY950_00095 [bacterium]|nr:hypothetical protein [bacterium]
MKSKLLRICLPAAVMIVLILSFAGCKGFGVPDYELRIEISEGIQGTPAAGVYTYEELTVIEYNYSPLDDSHIVEVIVNGSRWVAEGKFTLFSNMDVVVRILDIRGTWNFLKEAPSDSTDDSEQFSVTFSGAAFLSGDFTDGRGYNGTWVIDDDTLTMTYTDWNGYVFVGKITTMEGDWSGEGETGKWSASRAN